jgi:hypothetical protein
MGRGSAQQSKLRQIPARPDTRSMPNVGRTERLPKRAVPDLMHRALRVENLFLSLPAGAMRASGAAWYRDLAKLLAIHQAIGDPIAYHDRVRTRQRMTSCYHETRRSIGLAKPA